MGRQFNSKLRILMFLLVLFGVVIFHSHTTYASTNIGLKWSKTVPSIINESSPMPININGQTYVTFGAWDGDIHVVSGINGTEAPGWPQYTGYKIDSTPSNGDINGDGSPEIFSGVGIADIKCSGGGLISYTSTGVKRFFISTPDAVPGPGDQCQTPAIHASPALGDINKDGQTDATFGALGLKSWSVNQSGNTNFGWPFYWDDTQYGSPALADINGDGQTDVVLPGDSSPGGPVDWRGGMVRAMTGYGQPIWEYKTNEIVRSSPSIGDVDGNGDVEIIFGTGNYWANNGGASDSTKVFELNRAGKLICSHDVGAEVMASPTLADFNGDGVLDIGFGTWQTPSGVNDGKVWVLDGKTCNPMPNYPINSGGFLVLGQITTADINHDGAQDLIVPTANGVHAFDGKTGSSLFVLNQGVASYKNAPLITDVDNNGQLDIIIAGTEGDGKTGLVQRYEINASEGSVPGDNWSMFRKNTQETGSWTNIPLNDAPTGQMGQGYWLVASDGGVFPFGNAKGFGSTGNIRLTKPVIGMTSTPDGQGYWLVAADGGIFPFGDAGGYGSAGNLPLVKPIVGMQRTPDGHGYWLVAADGGVFTYGDAGYYGSTGNVNLTQPIVGMTSTPSGHGYWLVAADGGVFPFGDAIGYGSTGNIRLTKPMVSMQRTPDGHGYWLVAADGGVFPFGDAIGYGSAGNIALAKPIVGSSATPNGGYTFVAADGGVFNYNGAYYGSTGGLPLAQPVIGISYNF